MKAVRVLIFQILLLLRGIIRPICKFILGFIVISGILIYNLEDSTFKEKMIPVILGSIDLSILLGYDALLRLLCPDDRELILPN